MPISQMGVGIPDGVNIPNEYTYEDVLSYIDIYLGYQHSGWKLRGKVRS